MIVLTGTRSQSSYLGTSSSPLRTGSRGVITCTTSSNEPGTCKPLLECPITDIKALDVTNPACRPLGYLTLCCPSGSGGQQRLVSEVSPAGTLVILPPDVPIPDLKPQYYQAAVKATSIAACTTAAAAAAVAAAQDVIYKRIELEKKLVEQNITIQPNTPASYHLNLFQSTPETIAIGAIGLMYLQSYIQFTQMYYPNTSF